MEGDGHAHGGNDEEAHAQEHGGAAMRLCMGETTHHPEVRSC